MAVETLDEVITSSLYSKLAQIQERVGEVAKTGHVSFGRVNFDHFQEHGLFAVIKPLLAEFKLALIPSCDGWEKVGNHTIVNFRLTLVDTESRETHTVSFPNEGVDDSDKGFNKAYTGAMKYGLQKLFLVPTDKVDEQEGSDPAHNTASSRTNVTSSPGNNFAKPASDKQKALIEKLREQKHPTVSQVRGLLVAAGVSDVPSDPASLKAAVEGLKGKQVSDFIDGLIGLPEAA